MNAAIDAVPVGDVSKAIENAFVALDMAKLAEPRHLAVNRSAPAVKRVNAYAVSSQAFGQVTLGEPQWGQ
jgi:hypothetical protein